MYITYSEIMSPNDSSRPYRKRKRAQAEDETRRRITEAAVALHGTVGPANTKLTDLAHLAGVSRATLYNHFPTQADLFMACSSHWAARNPFPDPSAWKAIADPPARLVAGLQELYRWYRPNEGMLANVLRDLALLPALAEVMDHLWGGYLERVVRALARGWVHENIGKDELRALLRLMVDFHTWEALARAGLEDDRAAQLAANMVVCAGGRRGDGS
jgi:AcrR family transcriptional regulator